MGGMHDESDGIRCDHAPAPASISYVAMIAMFSSPRAKAFVRSCQRARHHTPGQSSIPLVLQGESLPPERYGSIRTACDEIRTDAPGSAESADGQEVGTEIGRDMISSPT
ncbi:MAG: hypothetical protein SGPRY_009586, partial [Prymnesium sp.]